MGVLQILPVPGIPEVAEGTDLASLTVAALRKARLSLENRDVLVVKQKIVSKAEGRIVKLEGVRPGKKALSLATRQGKDPRLVELILRESVRVVREGHGVIITETKQGLVCANAGIDKSNVRIGFVSLLPLNPDSSARALRRGLEKATGKKLAVVISDTFGRPWRKGQTDVAIGSSGIAPLLSYRGRRDRFGYELRVTEPAVVDEIAGAAELVSGKLAGIPVTIVRGAEYVRNDSGVRALVMERKMDLFR